MVARHRALLALTLTASLVALTACSSGGGGSSGDVAFSTKSSGTLKAWGFNNADDVGKARLAYAKSQLKGVTVSLDQTAFDAQKFTTRVASGQVPDVVQMDASFVNTYAAQGLILPLDKCYAAHKVTPSSEFYPQVIDYIRYRSQVFAVPQFYQPPAILLNERVMKAAGVTDSDIDTSKPDTLIAAIKKMTVLQNGKPTRIGFDAQATGQSYLWLQGQGGRIVDGSGKPTLTDPANAKAIDLLKRIYDAEGGYAKVKSFADSFDFFGAKNQFVKDQVGAEVDAQWYVNVLTPYAKQVSLGAVPFKDPSGAPYTTAGGTAFVIPAGAKNKDAACSWMLALTSDPAWIAAAEARKATLAKSPGSINTGLFTGNPSADQKIRSRFVQSSGNAGFDKAISTYYDVLPTGKSFGASPAGQDIQTEIANAITAVLLGQKSSTQALADAQKSAERAYSQATQG
ncbi:MAG TPA: extracellular solute-binding protein [Amnibacterium sp.]|jgi:multiple sugar transport system substrate-binding protein|uniref:ABC transporter substrate-binding protein n=1 Tax=Amnibacterium sp. TaxID=1872496 RepID=UPI002F95D4DD